jgi:hypothetical protein
LEVRNESASTSRNLARIENAARRAKRAERICLAGSVFAAAGFVLAVLNLIFGG